MTVSNTTLKGGPYNGDGVTTNFATGFYFLSSSEFIVTLLKADGSTEILDLGSDYTVTGAGVANGGTVILSSGAIAPVGTTITITPSLSLIQDQAYPAVGAFPAAATEQGFDRCILIDQQLLQLIGNCMQIPASDSGANTILPTAPLRKGMFLGFDANGAPVAIAGSVNNNTNNSVTYEIDSGTIHAYTSLDWGNDVNRAAANDMLDTIGTMPAGWWTYIYNRTSLYSIYLTPSAGSLVVDNTQLISPLVIQPGQRVKIMSVGNGNYNVLHLDQMPRTRLLGNTTFYVATTGNDSNSGLTSARAFLTIQKAIDTIANKYDLNGFMATISVANGTYTGTVTVSGPWTGNGVVQLTGNTTTPGNCIISTSSDCFDFFGVISVGGFKLISSAGNGLVANSGSRVTVNGKMEYGACASAQIMCENGAEIDINSAYTISGGAANHYYIQLQGRFSANGITVTLTGTPAYTAAFIYCLTQSLATTTSLTFSGSATGTRYVTNTGGLINTNGGGSNYFPGNSAGSAIGGTYV